MNEDAWKDVHVFACLSSMTTTCSGRASRRCWPPQPDIEVVAQASGGRIAVRLADELQAGRRADGCPDAGPGGPGAHARDPRARSVDPRAGAHGRLRRRRCRSRRRGRRVRVPRQGHADRRRRHRRSGRPHRAWRGCPRGRPRSSSAACAATASSPSRTPARSTSCRSRELEVLRLIASGMENAEIARALGISPRTAKNHVSNILAKLGLPSRIQAAIYAVRRGLQLTRHALTPLPARSRRQHEAERERARLRVVQRTELRDRRSL